MIFIKHCKSRVLKQVWLKGSVKHAPTNWEPLRLQKSKTWPFLKICQAIPVWQHTGIKNMKSSHS